MTSQPCQVPWHRETPEWLESTGVGGRERDGDEGGCRAYRLCGFHSKHTWETAMLEGFMQGGDVSSWKEHSGNPGARVQLEVAAVGGTGVIAGERKTEVIKSRIRSLDRAGGLVLEVKAHSF